MPQTAGQQAVPRRVSIRYYRIEKTQHLQLTQVLKDVENLFIAANLGIAFEDGGLLDADPSYSSDAPFPKLVQRWRQENGPARLVFGSTYRASPKKVAGALMDVDTRGVAAVFCKSDRLNVGDVGELTATTAHEVGHLFNLVHEQPGPFDSIMMVADDRKQSILDAWTAARVRAEGDPYFRLPAPLPRCHPLSEEALRALREEPDDVVLPWRTAFREPGGTAA